MIVLSSQQGRSEQFPPVVGEDENLSQFAPADPKRQFINEHPFWSQLESYFQSSDLIKISSLPEFSTLVNNEKSDNPIIFTRLGQIHVGDPVFRISSFSMPHSQQHWAAIETQFGSYFISFPLSC